MTTTTTTTTPTTTLPPPSIEDFIAAYAQATIDQDGAFFFDNLLPELVEIYGAELCRDRVEREILAISDYQLIGDINGPRSRTLTVGDNSFPVENYYEAQVRFTFQGETFDVVATYVTRDGQVYWIGECR